MSLKHSLLALLSRQSKTGYELSKEIEGSTGFFWTASHQQIYRDLADLEEKNWVQFKEIEQATKPDKKRYSVTKKGLAELKRWVQEPTDPPPSKDAFLIKLLAGDLVEPAVLLEDLLRQKAIHLAKRKKYEDIEKQYFQNVEKLSPERRFQYLTLRRGILSEAAWLKWCHEAEEFLRDQSKR